MLFACLPLSSPAHVSPVLLFPVSSLSPPLVGGHLLFNKSLFIQICSRGPVLVFWLTKGQRYVLQSYGTLANYVRKVTQSRAIQQEDPPSASFVKPPFFAKGLPGFISQKGFKKVFWAAVVNRNVCWSVTHCCPSVPPLLTWESADWMVPLCISCSPQTSDRWNMGNGSIRLKDIRYTSNSAVDSLHLNVPLVSVLIGMKVMCLFLKPSIQTTISKQPKWYDRWSQTL